MFKVHVQLNIPTGCKTASDAGRKARFRTLCSVTLSSSNTYDFVPHLYTYDVASVVLA